MTLPKGYGKSSGSGGGSGRHVKHSGHGKAIAVLVIIAIIGLLIGGWVWSVHQAFEKQNRLIEAGCVPAAFNQYGVVVSWLGCYVD